jgi:hypothetical protein
MGPMELSDNTENINAIAATVVNATAAKAKAPK